MKAIIVDDIKESRINLKADLKDYCPEIEVIGEADGVVSALKLIKTQSLDLLFLDIQLLDGSGFDVLELLPKVDFKVIFTTASDAFAIKAFKFSAIDYLLKPIDPDELVAAVQNAQKQKNLEKSQMEVLKETMQIKEQPRQIALHTSEKIVVSPVAEILRCESFDNYTTFYFKDKSKLVVSKTLKQYEQLLQDAGFYRVHQKHLVNLACVKALLKTDGGYILMSDGSEVPISTRKKADVFKLFPGN